MTELLSTYSPEGLCYRVDLRLRPEASWVRSVSRLKSARQYYATRARDWELQMLIKPVSPPATPRRALTCWISWSP